MGGTRGVAFANRLGVSEPRIFTVDEDDDGIRLDRWFKRHMPEVSFNLVSRWARTGQLRLAGKRAVPGDRVEAGQEIRVPPLDSAPARPARAQPPRDPLTEANTTWLVVPPTDPQKGGVYDIHGGAKGYESW